VCLRDVEGRPKYLLGISEDITVQKAAQDEIKNLAFFDPLTQLPNRRLLMDRLKKVLASSARSGKQNALLFIDLDNFKTLNDSLGHNIGDLLLQKVTQRLLACIREGDTVARLGGDEFVVMLEDLASHAPEAATQAEAVARQILVALNAGYRLEGYDHRSTASIGITLFSGNQESMEELLKRADMAMYQAKAAGRNTLRFFDPEMQAIVTNRAALEADLHEAVLRDQLVLHYQVQVDAQDGVIGAEALLRWRHPQRGMVQPLDFIALAEDTGLILPIGNWVLNTACVQLRAWSQRPQTAQFTMAVNVSARQIHAPDFVEQVLGALRRTQADPRRLKLELTESLLVRDVDEVIAKMAALKAYGVGFSLDDFGTGYSSLQHLKRLPLDQLKIDRGFVDSILTDPNDAAIAKMVIALADSMGLNVIAEGVETAAQREFLAQLGCHAYQGYLFGRPLPREAFEDWGAPV
jgi:diguanylate cyclase (GGDEF)-like protein